MITILRAGGWVMFLLGTIALILYFTAFDLLFYVYKGNLKEKTESKWLEWIRHPELGEGMVGTIVQYAQREPYDADTIRQRFEEIRLATVTEVAQRMVLLRTLVAAAPLAGLLGTVIGMLGTFAGIANGGIGDTMEQVAGGIKEALITTQTGLMVALPGVFFVLLIKKRLDGMTAAIGRLESLTLVAKTDVEQSLDQKA
ncbi:MAG: MotA/TolQ/ExbB proton channel family protein [Verrucomicrobia bacterium]|nr:MotA/TolQ/ExbB proton channel family protein [Verrucomicrobiota bacterium]